MEKRAGLLVLVIVDNGTSLRRSKTREVRKHDIGSDSRPSAK